MATNAYKNQHLVTRSLQRRWTNDDTGASPGRLVCVTRSDVTSVSLASPKRNLAEDWFIGQKADPERYEKSWGDAESAMALAYVALDAHRGDDPVDDAASDAIKDFMALHAVRSKLTKLQWVHGLATVDPKRKAALAADSDLVDRLRATGEFETSLTDGQLIDEVVARLDDPLAIGGKGFGDTLLEVWTGLKRRFGAMYVEIAESVGSEFVLPDFPVVTFNAETGAVGIQNGVGLDCADTIVMPVGPRHVASLTTQPPELPWDRIDVGRTALLNTTLCEAAVEAVYFRPGSGLDATVQASLAV